MQAIQFNGVNYFMEIKVHDYGADLIINEASGYGYGIAWYDAPIDLGSICDDMDDFDTSLTAYINSEILEAINEIND